MANCFEKVESNSVGYEFNIYMLSVLFYPVLVISDIYLKRRIGHFGEQVSTGFSSVFIVA